MCELIYLLLSNYLQVSKSDTGGVFVLESVRPQADPIAAAAAKTDHFTKIQRTFSGIVCAAKDRYLDLVDSTNSYRLVAACVFDLPGLVASCLSGHLDANEK